MSILHRSQTPPPASCPPMTALPPTAAESRTLPPEPTEPLSSVVVLTAPDGHRYLSHASLMTVREAEREAGEWRRGSFGADVHHITREGSK